MSLDAMDSNSVEIFYSYASEDERLRNRLEKHLSILMQQEFISDWYNRKISAGKEWSTEVNAHLNTAGLILLLISPDFLASDYCYSIEMKLALERHKQGKAIVIPIILRPVVWGNAPFASLQALPKNHIPITKWPNRDEAFLNVVIGIQEATETLFQNNKKVPKTKQTESDNQEKYESPAQPYILVIDDDEFANSLIQFVLSKEGYEVETTSNPRGAMQMISKREPDFLIVDVMMPYLNGFDFAAKLREGGFGIPFIFMTAQDAIEAKLQGFGIGADDYICKPFNHLEIVLRVRAVLRRLHR